MLHSLQQKAKERYAEQDDEEKQLASRLFGIKLSAPAAAASPPASGSAGTAGASQSTSTSAVATAGVSVAGI